MKIYFAGSIFGGRDDIYIYKQIIDLLKKYGEVLTEHVGNNQYSPNCGKDVPANEYIYTQDMEWLQEADFFIAEVTTPSIGVGYEIKCAEMLNKKILCLYRNGGEKQLSFMVSGNKNIITKVYKTVEDLPEILKEFFK